MSILAEPRRKQRISVDPQNIAWKNDNEKFGKKLMEKFGWSEGKGLGLQEQGMSKNLKLKANHTAKGLGCEHNYESTWINHHDDFASLLAGLNKNKPSSDDAEKVKKEETTKSLEETSKSSKARIHYHKFTRGKDLSRFSSQDKSAVIGVGISRKRKHSPELAPDVGDGEEPTKKAKKEKKEKRDVEADTGFAEKTTVSQVSVADYFAEKMRKMKERASAAKKGIAAPQAEVTTLAEETNDAESEQKEETEEERKLRKQKRKEEKRRLKEEARCLAEAEAQVEVKVENQEVAEEEEKLNEETKEERKRRKREKKLRKLAEAQGQENEA